MTGEIDVAESLREAILRGDYIAGQRLVEADLCEHFGTTRFIIRTALQSLAAQGLVEVRRNRGARVRTVSIEEAIEITEVRRALEGLCAARAAQRATRDDRADLRQIVRDMKAAWKNGELLQYSELNAKLHATIRVDRQARDLGPDPGPAARADGAAPVPPGPGAGTPRGLAAAARGDRRRGRRGRRRRRRAGHAPAHRQCHRGAARPGCLSRTGHPPTRRSIGCPSSAVVTLRTWGPWNC